jgi:hypothetical protein
LSVLRLVARAVLRVSGVLVRLRCWLCSIRRLAVGTGIRFPVYDAKTDGNVFDWLISTAEDFRKIRQRERDVELEKAAAKSEVLDSTKVEN